MKIKPFLFASLLGLNTSGYCASVALKGVSGNKALVSINGQFPRFIQEGQSESGVMIVRIQGSSVVFREGAHTYEMKVGDTRANPEGQVPALQNSQTNTAVVAKSIQEDLMNPTRTVQAVGESRVLLLADQQGHYLADGMINNKPVRFLVDTGATAIAMSEDKARQLGVRYENSAKSTARTAGGERTTYSIILPKVSVGGLILADVPALVLANNPQNGRAELNEVLLGMSFLSRVKITTERNQLILEKH